MGRSCHARPRSASVGAGLAAAILGSAAVTLMMGCPVLARFAGYAKPTRFLAIRGLCLLATGLVALPFASAIPSSLALLLAATVAAVSRSGVPRRTHFCLLHRSPTDPAAAGPRSTTASSPDAPNSPAHHRRRSLSAQLGLTKGIAPVLRMPSTERPDPGAIAAGADRPR